MFTRRRRGTYGSRPRRGRRTNTRGFSRGRRRSGVRRSRGRRGPTASRIGFRL